MSVQLLAVPKSVSAVRKSSSGIPAPRVSNIPLQLLHRYADSLGMPLMCVETTTGTCVAQTDRQLLPWVPEEFTGHRRINATQVVSYNSGVVFFSIPLAELQGQQFAATGYVLTMPGVRPQELVRAAQVAGWTTEELDDWLDRLPFCPPDMLRRHLSLGLHHSRQVEKEAVAQEEINQIVSQLHYSYQEINLLHVLTQNMQVSRSAADVFDLCLTQLTEVVQAESHCIWLTENGQTVHLAQRGRSPLSQAGQGRLLERFENQDWSHPLVKNHISGTLLGADFPGLRNFLLAPIAAGETRSGWLLVCNLSHDEEFSTLQVDLLTSIASLLGTHSRNRELFRQHEELLLSFVKSMVSSLDAKDAYTRGHSERVALIARRIGAELRLPEEDLRDIYLSGLLHDIGKIGLDDQILRKPGNLTDEEFSQVKKHPVIGHNILSGIKNLNSVIPGVRHHHEAWGGGGYPDNIAGEEIPLMARIMAVADAYDAMGSDRPYRKGMPLAKLEAVLREGSGKQWDPAVIAAYFACREEIREICEQHQRGDDNLRANAEEYMVPLSSSRPDAHRVRTALMALADYSLPVAAASS